MWSGGHCGLKDNVSFQVSGNGIPTTELAAPRQERKSWHPWLLGVYPSPRYHTMEGRSAAPGETGSCRDVKKCRVAPNTPQLSPQGFTVPLLPGLSKDSSEMWEAARGSSLRLSVLR